MKINRVIHNNLDSVYDACLRGIKSDSALTTFQSIPKLYTTTSISYYIEDASLIESYILSHMSNGIMTGSSLKNPFKELKIPQFETPTDNIMNALITMQDDESIGVYPGSMILPIGCNRRDMIVTFTDKNLLELLGNPMENIFDPIFKKDMDDILKADSNNKNNERPDIVYPDKLDLNDIDIQNKLVNILIYKFRSEFYNTYTRLIINMEYPYTEFLSKKYFNFLDKKKSVDVAVSNLISPYGMINFIGKTNPQVQLQNYKKVLNDVNGIKHIGTITFIVKSSILAFLELGIWGDVTLEPLDLFFTLTDNQLQLPSYLMRYKNRTVNKLRDIIDEKSKLIQKKEEPYKIYETIIGLTPVKYLLTMPLTKVLSGSLVNPLKESNILVNQLNEIINNINKIGKSVDNLLYG